MATDKYTMDMAQGPLFRQILTFAWPLFLSMLLQLCFHTADLIVVGQFSSAEDLAAVGASGMIVSVFFSVFSGLAVGANVLISKNYGAKKHNLVIKGSHTAIAIAIYGGILLGIAGLICTDTFLHIVNVPDSLLVKSRNYVMLFFAGTPFAMLYNFGSAILRSVGDSKRPLIFVAISGVVNIILNLVFVIVFKMGVVGVALATLLSNILSAFLIFQTLRHTHSSIGIKIPLIRINFSMFRSILQIGVPAGLQSAMFGVSNLTILSSINTFGENTIAGNTAANSLEAICWIATT